MQASKSLWRGWVGGVDIHPRTRDIDLEKKKRCREGVSVRHRCFFKLSLLLLWCFLLVNHFADKSTCINTIYITIALLLLGSKPLLINGTIWLSIYQYGWSYILNRGHTTPFHPFGKRHSSQKAQGFERVIYPRSIQSTLTYRIFIRNGTTTSSRPLACKTSKNCEWLGWLLLGCWPTQRRHWWQRIHPEWLCCRHD